ncbi:MAG: DUF4290 domain-containing protein [Bacteroidota bacterium]
MTDQELDLEYNTERKQLIIPEYGRAVHKMVDYCVTLADREERNKCARSIISIMGNLFPQLRDVEDYRHKLWDHMFIMSEFQLDVDSPYPRPTQDILTSLPEKLSYPKGNIRYGHYGRVTQQFIEKALTLENPEHKEKMATQLFYLMKRSYKAWNRDHVEDEVVLGHLSELSKGGIILDPSKVSGGDGIPNTPYHPAGHGTFNKKKKWNNNNSSNNNKNFKHKNRNKNTNN